MARRLCAGERKSAKASLLKCDEHLRLDYLMLRPVLSGACCSWLAHFGIYFIVNWLSWLF